MHFAAHFFHKMTRMHTFCLILVGFLISTAISPLREQLLKAVGDRRAVYVDMSSSVAYLSFWLGLWFALLLRWRNTLQTLDGRYAVIILSILDECNIFRILNEIRRRGISIPIDSQGRISIKTPANLDWYILGLLIASVVVLV